MNKTLLITGGTSGIGYEAAKEIAAAGCTLIFTARDEAKAQKVKAEIMAATNNSKVSYVLVDFVSLSSVHQAATQLTGQLHQLDVLINNAGVWEMERKQTADGIEMNFGVNHLAPFLLTHLLLPLLKKSQEGRIVNTSSMAHRRNILQLDNPEFKNQVYDGVATYSQSKLCNLLFTLHLTEVLKDTLVTANTVHPGYVKTDLFNNMGTRDWQNVPAASDGAISTVYAALSDDLKGISGKYIYHHQFQTPTPMALDKELAKNLWNLSIQYVAPYLNLNN